MEYFKYGECETNWLKSRDKALAAAIDELGPLQREVTPDLYQALVQQIISQQISTKGAITIWNRLVDAIGEVTPSSIDKSPDEVIQKCGMSMRKVLYIKELTSKVLNGVCELEALPALPDAEVCTRLSALKGIGVWTAEMLMTFSMQRPDIMSWDDMAIHKGLRMLYRHRRITKELFSKYKKRYSPYASVACLYLWAVAGGGCASLDDPAPQSEARKRMLARQRRKKNVKNKEAAE